MPSESGWKCELMSVVPLGLFSLSVFFDMHTLASGDGSGATIAFWVIAVGVAVGIAAAPFVLAQCRRIPTGAFARDVGMWQCVTNLLVLVLFAGSLFLRAATPARPPWMGLLLSFIAVPLALVNGWLAGEFSERVSALKTAIHQWRS